MERAAIASVIVLFALFSFRNAFGQDAKPSFLVGGSLTMNLANEAITAFDNSTTSCGIYKSGDGTKPSFFGGSQFPLDGRFSFEAKLEYNNLSTGSQILAQETPAFESYIHSTVPINRDRNYYATVSMAGLGALVSYALLPRFSVSAGPFLGILVNHSYLETEEIISPSLWVYPDGYTTRTIGSSVLNSNALQVGMELEASYELPIEPHLALRPSLSAAIPFTQINSNTNENLRSYSYNASLALVYHIENLFTTKPTPPEIASENNPPLSTEPLSKPITATPVMEPKKSMLTVSVKALGVGNDGQEVSEPVVSIERMHVTEVYPMLHYVFFEDGSSAIPSRYIQSTSATRSGFNEKELFTANALDIHHHVLDIIGKRLLDNPNASVTLVGTRSEHSENDSQQGTTIALARAKSIQNYLADVWDISRDRLHLRERSLPEIASDDRNPFGQAENRRVEIIPSSPTITAPLWTERVERIATPPQIDFEPEITSAAGIRSATISVFQHDRLLYKIDALDTVTHQYNWTIDSRSMPADNPAAVDSLRYVFTAIDSSNDTAEAEGIIHVRQNSHDTSVHASDTSTGKQIDKYSLILFDYSSSTLDKKESEAIVEQMAASIGHASSITLTGHTDKTGDDNYNDRLSRDRVMRAATMLEQALHDRKKSHEPLVTESHGSRDLLFDNSIPEGRVLSRTVRATIETGGE